MSKKKTHVLLIISICVVIIAVFGWFVFAFVFGGPLSGIKHHSFGVVPIERPSSTLTHTFRLVNTTDHELRLTDAVPSCGCTTSDWPKEPVGAGEVLAIPVNLRLRRSQLRSSKVRLVFETGEIVVLRIDGIGRFTQPLHMAPYVPVLYPTAMQGTRAVLSLEWSDDSVHPTKPVIETPDGLRVEFDDWILSKEEDSNKGIPEVWTIRMRLFVDAETIDPLEFTVKMKDTPELVVPFTIDTDIEESLRD
mgnify:CR=1 FL=1|tara:strand:- start:910 stop:1656 length:747 start_codon:yes stop_codon:yes gene_type:complete